MAKIESRFSFLSLISNKLSYLASIYASKVNLCIILVKFLSDKSGHSYPKIYMISENNLEKPKSYWREILKSISTLSLAFVPNSSHVGIYSWSKFLEKEIFALFGHFGMQTMEFGFDLFMGGPLIDGTMSQSLKRYLMSRELSPQLVLWANYDFQKFGA